jgi:dipeptidyl aminopeptidase/acylaminoacyl peptidase
VYAHGDTIKLINSGDIDLQFLSYDLLWYPKALKMLNLHTKNETTGNLRVQGKLSESTNSVFVGTKPIIINNIVIDGAYNNFPDLETLDSISVSGKYILAINENNLYLSVASKQAMEYLYSPILNKLYDYTKYEKVLFADDGRYMIYSKNDKMYLKDINFGQEEQLNYTTHVHHINGYMPLVKTDLNRRPVLINPLTMGVINEESLRNFKFVSPNGLFYAKSDQIIKTFNTLNNEYITQEEVQSLKNIYNDYYLDDDETKKQKEILRLELYESHKEVFENVAKHTIYTNNFYSNCFTDIFLKEHGFVYVYSTQTQEQLHEISLGIKLLYLNYISFSFDSRYVAITGKYKNNGGLVLLYDMQLCQEVFKIDGSTNLRTLFNDNMLKNTYTKAIWSSAFTKSGRFATYSSDPNLYFIEPNDDKVITNIIEDRSFLAFSPDGKYIIFDAMDKKANQDLYIISVDGGDLTRLTMNKSNDSQPYWSSSDGYIYFVSNRGGKLGDLNIWRFKY